MIDKKVVSIKAIASKPVEPNQEVVSKMQQLLAMAESGELRDIFFYGSLACQDSVSGIAVEDMSRATKMVGEVMLMNTELQDMILEHRYGHLVE